MASPCYVTFVKSVSHDHALERQLQITEFSVEARTVVKDARERAA